MPLREIFTSCKIYVFCFFKLFAMPIAIVLLDKLIGLSAEMIYLVAIMSALSTAANAAMFAEIYDIRPRLAAHAVGMSSMLSAAAIPAVLALTRLIISL